MLCEYGKRAPDVRAERAKGVKGWPRGGVDGSSVGEFGPGKHITSFFLFFSVLLFLFSLKFKFESKQCRESCILINVQNRLSGIEGF